MPGPSLPGGGDLPGGQNSGIPPLPGQGPDNGQVPLPGTTYPIAGQPVAGQPGQLVVPPGMTIPPGFSPQQFTGQQGMPGQPGMPTMPGMPGIPSSRTVTPPGAASNSGSSFAVSYTHLTLPTIYSV